MKLKTLLLALGTTAGLTLAASGAQAASIAQLISANPNFIIEDDSAESQGVDQGPADCTGCAIGVIDVGDTLRGIVEFPTLVNANTLQDFDLDGTTNSHLSAVFEVEVISKTLSAVQNPNTPGQDFDFVFGPNAAFAAALGLPAGTMVAFYEDDVDDVATGGVFPPADGPCTTIGAGGDCEGNVTNGTLILALGFSATEFDEAWVAFSAPETPGDAQNILPGSSIGEFNFQLDVLFSAIGAFAENKPTFIDGLPGGNNLIAWIGSGGVQGTSGVDTPYDIRDDAQLQASIPEPTTLGLMGAGLVVLAGVARRRFRKAA